MVNQAVHFLWVQPRRLVSLVFAMLSNLSAGTRYAFPLFGPPIAKQLGYSHLQLNIIASTGDIGTYLGAPLFGGLVDRFGAGFGCLLAAVFMFLGFNGLASMYDGQLFSSSYLLAAFFFTLTGSGSASACMAALSTTARNFPSELRGSMLGLPVSFYGLSALVLSIVNSWWFVKPLVVKHGVETGGEADTLGFLRMLAFVCSGVNLLSVWGLKQVPIEDDAEEVNTEASVDVTDSCSPVASTSTDAATSTATPQIDTRARSHSDTPLLTDNHIEQQEQQSCTPNMPVLSDEHIPLKVLFTSGDFWQLWCMMGILTGTGLMYITNVGGMVRQLLVDNPDDEGVPSEGRLQLAASTHVALISMGSFSARLMAGAISDYTKRKYQIRRLTLVIYTSIIMMLAQIMALKVSTASGLIAITLMVGCTYGALFTLFTAITSEYWGVTTFGRNWGWMSCSPGVGGQVFNLIFGAMFDARMEQPDGCTGHYCYRDTFYITTAGCVCAIILGWSLRERRRRRDQMGYRLQRSVAT